MFFYPAALIGYVGIDFTIESYRVGIWLRSVRQVGSGKIVVCSVSQNLCGIGSSYLVGTLAGSVDMQYYHSNLI